MKLGSLRSATLVAALALLGLTGCASHFHTPFQQESAPAPRMPAALDLAEFENPLAPIQPVVLDDAETKDYWVSSISLPSVGENGQDGNLVTGRYYQGKGPGAKPLIFVLPVWGISDYPPNAISKDLLSRAEGNVDVLQVLGENKLFDWDALAKAQTEAEFLDLMDRMTDRFVSTVIDIRRLVDWAERQPSVDPRRVGLIGFSMSALVASITVATEPRFDAGILVMGGADLHEAFATCGSRMKRVREAVSRRFGWTLDQFKKMVEGPLARVNPTRVAGLVDPRRVLIIEADKDTCLRRPGRDRLWEAMGRPERIAYGYGHNMSFLAMTLLGGYDLQRQVHRFLGRTILPGAPKFRYEANRFLEERLDLPAN